MQHNDPYYFLIFQNVEIYVSQNNILGQNFGLAEWSREWWSIHFLKKCERCFVVKMIPRVTYKYREINVSEICESNADLRNAYVV